MSLIERIRQNPFTALLVVVILWLAWQQIQTSTSITKAPQLGYETSSSYRGGDAGIGGTLPPIQPEFPPTTGQDRKVITNTHLSLLVDNVHTVQQQAQDYATTIGGYVVSSSTTRPTEVPYGKLTLRIPANEVEKAMVYFRRLAVKVTYEQVTGVDVTDEYVDIAQHIQNLQTTKLRYEEIRERATTVEELLQVTREITNIQTQIDSYKGRQQYIEQSALFAKVTLELSSDELALSYTPDTTFRPAVTFKLAIRSLYGTMRNLGELAIWIGVYAVIWVPLLVIALWLYMKNRKQQPSTRKKLPTNPTLRS